MSFDEFLSRRLTELLRIAFLLAGDRTRAEDLACRVLADAFAHWTNITGDGRPFAVVRTGIVRAYLMASADHEPDDDGEDDPLRGVEPRPRAALVLATYSDQTVNEIGEALRLTVDVVESELARARCRTRAAAGLLERLEQWAEDAMADTEESVAVRLLDRIENATGDEDAERQVFAELFAGTVPLAGTSYVLDPPATQPAQGPTMAWELPPAAAPEAPAGPDVSPDEPADEAADVATGLDDEVPRARTGIVGRIAVAAAMVAAAVAVTALVSHKQHGTPKPGAVGSVRSSATPTPASTSVGPDSPVGPSLPGTKILREYYGSGSRSIKGGDYPLASGRQLAVNVVCSGPGQARIGAIVVPSCDGQAVEASVTTEQLRSPLRITADPSTTWRFVLADEPAHGTNGSLTFPADPLLTSASPVQRVGQASGIGSATVPLVSGTTGSRVDNLRLIVSCTGAGMSFSSSDGRFDGLYTTTCFKGWSYEFDTSGVLLPGTLTVRASAGTSWHLVVIRG